MSNFNCQNYVGRVDILDIKLGNHIHYPRTLELILMEDLKTHLNII